MSKPILLAIDFTPNDERALAIARGVSRLADAPLVLVHVIGTPPADAAANATKRTQLESQLAALARRVSAEVDHPVTRTVIHANDVGDALIHHARESDATVLVMATHARDAVGRVIWGSVADRMMRESPVPVLLAPPGTMYMRGRVLHFSRVLVPLDASTLSARALDYILALPGAKSLEYALIEVVQGEDERAAARERLAAAAERVRAAGARSVEFDVGLHDDVAPVVVEAVREASCDLIMMSSRGTGGLQRLLLGSVAQHVVQRAEVPVLLLTPTSLSLSTPGEVEAAAQR